MRSLEEIPVEREQTIGPSTYPVSVGAERCLLRGPRGAMSSMRSVFRRRQKPGHGFSKRSSRDAIVLRRREASFVARVKFISHAIVLRVISHSRPRSAVCVMTEANQVPEPTRGLARFSLRSVVFHLTAGVAHL